MVDGLISQSLFGVHGRGSTVYYFPIDLDWVCDPGIPNPVARSRTMGVMSPDHYAKQGIIRPTCSFNGDLTSQMALLHLAYISQHKVSAARGGNTKAATWTFKGGFRDGTSSTPLTYFHESLQFFYDAGLTPTNAGGRQINNCVPTSFTISGSDGRIRFSSSWMGKSYEHIVAPSLPTTNLLEDGEFEFEQDVYMTYGGTEYTIESFELNFVLEMEHTARTYSLAQVSIDTSGNTLTMNAGTATTNASITAASGTPFSSTLFRKGNWITLGSFTQAANNNSFRIVDSTSTVLYFESGKINADTATETVATVTFNSARRPWGEIVQNGRYRVNGQFTRTMDGYDFQNKYMANTTTQTTKDEDVPTLDVSTGAALVFTIGDRTLVTGAAAGLNHKVAITMSSAIFVDHGFQQNGERMTQTISFENEFNTTDDGSWTAVVVAPCTGNAVELPIENRLNSQYASA